MGAISPSGGRLSPCVCVPQVPGPVQAGQGVREVHPGSGQEWQQRLLQAQEQPAAGGDGAVHGLAPPLPPGRRPLQCPTNTRPDIRVQVYVFVFVFAQIYFAATICNQVPFFLAKKALHGVACHRNVVKTGVKSWWGV